MIIVDRSYFCGNFQTGKHELYPFPFDVIQLNPWDEEKGVGLNQNPGRE